MSDRNIVPFNRKEVTKKKLVSAVGSILSKDGFKGLGVNKIAKRAKVDKKLIYRYFDGLPGLVYAYSETVDFWPTVEELLGPDPEKIRKMGGDDQMSFFFKSFLRALRKRPITQDILAWEMLEKNELSKQLEHIRVKTALEYFEQMENLPDDKDLTAIVMLMAGAIYFLLIRSRIDNSIGGLDLVTEEGWKRVEDGIDLLIHGTFNQ